MVAHDGSRRITLRSLFDNERDERRGAFSFGNEISDAGPWHVHPHTLLDQNGAERSRPHRMGVEGESPSATCTIRFLISYLVVTTLR